MTSRTLYHASLVSGLCHEGIQFFDNSHFAFEEEPCVKVLVRKYFADTLDHEYEAAVPTLYTCEAELDWVNQFPMYPDLKSPHPFGLFDAWIKREQEAKELMYGASVMPIEERQCYFCSQMRTHWQPMRREFNALSETQQVQWLKQKFAANSHVGYQYQNIIEGGISICLLDASMVKVLDEKPIEIADLANRFLHTPYEELSIGLDDESYAKALDRAKAVLHPPVIPHSPTSSDPTNGRVEGDSPA